MKYVYFSLAALLAFAQAASADDVSFIFSSRTRDGVVVQSNSNLNSVNLGQVFDPNLPTVVLVHGWQDNADADSNTYIRAAVLNQIEANIIKVDWGPLAKQGYTAAKDAVPGVGQLGANLLAQIKTQFNYDLRNVYVVGFSLGAHVAGNIGKGLNKQVGVIVALDPAGPLIKSTDYAYSVDPSDAIYVQGIHTNGGTLGMNDAVGHADFFVNGGSKQPGCGLDLLGSCSHNKAWEYFSESLGTNRFDALGCNSWNDFKNKKCNGGSRLMGGLQKIDKSATGKFYLETNSAAPYGRG